MESSTVSMLLMFSLFLFHNCFTLNTEILGLFLLEQDFHMLVANPRKQKLYIHVKDSFGFTDFTIGSGEVNP